MTIYAVQVKFSPKEKFTAPKKTAWATFDKEWIYAYQDGCRSYAILHKFENYDITFNDKEKIITVRVPDDGNGETYMGVKFKNDYQYKRSKIVKEKNIEARKKLKKFKLKSKKKETKKPKSKSKSKSKNK